MTTLTFAVIPADVTYLHDLLTCLARFDENISVEATAQGLRLSSLNISKSAYASFLLSRAFFQKYDYASNLRGSSISSSQSVWTCKLQNRALLSIFKRRLADTRDKDTALELCEFELQERPDQTESRLIFKLTCRHGVVKTYRLLYEGGEILHATFDTRQSPNSWTISSKTLSDIVEYFGPKTELLDWYCENERVTFTSYTEKIQSGREILKQPMHTSVALEKKDFDDFKVEEGLHVCITVKDFRTIVAHAETMHIHITARYSLGNRPMQISYETNGIRAEFTLMTRRIAGNRSSSSRMSTPARDLSVRPVSQPQATATSTPILPRTKGDPKMSTLSDQQSGRQQDSTPGITQGHSVDSAPAPSASINPDSLFIPADDDDQQWDEPNYEDEPDIVTWDSAVREGPNTSSSRRIQDSNSTSFHTAQDRNTESLHTIAPTQRLSQLRGLFD